MFVAACYSELDVENCYLLYLFVAACYSGLDVVNRRVENAKQCVVSRMMGELFLVPASCNFMLSSMSYFLHNYQQLAGNSLTDNCFMHTLRTNCCGHKS